MEKTIMRGEFIAATDITSEYEITREFTDYGRLYRVYVRNTHSGAEFCQPYTSMTKALEFIDAQRAFYLCGYVTEEMLNIHA